MTTQAPPANFIQCYLGEVAAIAQAVDQSAVERMIDVLVDIRDNGGRLFFLGVGGGAGNATHAVNDFRKIAAIESYSPCDNASELTARINDDGWESAFTEWLKGSRLRARDGVFILSVGGGNVEKNVSVNLVRALDYARQVGARILGVVGRDGGYTRTVADGCVVVPNPDPGNVTAHTESFQAVIWHLIVSHPKIRRSEMKWESVR